MQIEQLQIELRPRSNAQALDLGYALLRSHAGAAYMAFLVLWAPLIAIAAVLGWIFPDYYFLCTVGAWWLRPLIERAPLYVLSRQVFGTAVTWQQAVRAWPGLLGGGAWRLLTWGRPFAAGRALYQPVWMLEHARGKMASARMRVLSRERTGAAAFWFGFICVFLDAVMQFGLYGLIGFFISEPGMSNPFRLFAFVSGISTPPMALLAIIVFGVVAAIIAPIYTACGFTLYLNRRATLEAWDLELKLRQIQPPSGWLRKSAAAAAPLLLLFLLAPPAPVQAAPAAAPGKCKPLAAQETFRGPDHTPAQAALRARLDAIYAGEDLRNFVCEESWFRKRSNTPQAASQKPDDRNDLDALAASIKALLIAAAVGIVAWLLYKYRDKLPRLGARQRSATATEVGGLDIRAESLPDDVVAAVRALWTSGERRAALALLYRATLSRLVSHDALLLRQGDTEGDCLRLCRLAHQQGRLRQARLDIAIAATTLWLDGAYGNRWPRAEEVFARCDAWQAEYGQASAEAA